MWRSHRGFKIAVDVLVKIYVNGSLVEEVVASPEELEDLAMGFAYVSGYGATSKILIKEGNVYIYAGEGGLPAKVVDCGPASGAVERVRPGLSISLDDVKRLAGEFVKLTMPSVEPQLAMHTSAIYYEGDWVVVHDVSRHSGVLKLVGKALRLGLDPSKAIAFTTGRASGDMVQRLAKLGVPIVVSLRGPLYSGIDAACRAGVLLIANVRGVGFTPLCREDLLNHQ
ncbi:MAG: formate dehydrogenase accessory sulfurtransferase FdhD [Pyrobaculum sp.]